MWISQSYLGEAPRGAFCFVYYFFENYQPDQKAYTEQIEPYLSRLGMRLGRQVHLYGPNPIGYDNVAREILEKFNRYWRKFDGKLPGIFICQKPLKDFDPETDESVFLPLLGRDAENVLARLEEVIATQRILAATKDQNFDLMKFLTKEIQWGIQIGPISVTKK